MRQRIEGQPHNMHAMHRWILSERYTAHDFGSAAIISQLVHNE
jgi:hypothetical protein